MEPDPPDLLPPDLRELLGLLHRPKPIPRNANGQSKVNGSGRVSPEVLIQQAMDLVGSGRGRNDAGFLLAVQLRDNQFSESEAAEVMHSFVKRVPNGCLIGNFSAEVGAHSGTIHSKLAEMHVEIHESVVYCLKAAVKSGELPGTIDCKELAHFLYSSLQGAILQAKVERSRVSR